MKSKLGVFDYAGTNFKFSYPLSAEKGASTAEIEKNKVFQINISGEASPTITISIIDEEDGFVRVATNSNKVEYRKFLSTDGLNHLRFYGDKVIDIALAVPDELTYSDIIISSFEFTRTLNPLIND